MRIAAPRDAVRLRELVHEAVAVDDGPTAVRFPKGGLPREIDAVERVGTVDVLRRDPEADVLLVSYGAMASLSLEVADRLARDGIACTVVDPRWVLPVDSVLATSAASHSLVVTVEDNGRHGGAGVTLATALRDRTIDTPVRHHSIPQQFLHQGKRAEVLADIGLTADDIARQVAGAVVGLGALDPAIRTG